MFDIQQELKKLPAKPGVYLMHNSKDEIIYVGKAIKLCNRVRQYFQDSRNLSVKIQHMVKNVAYFEYIITDSELEALVLENNLIKEHHPKYNTKLKDDKGYPYIKVTVNEEFPRIMLARKMKADGGKYFGPYTSAGAVMIRSSCFARSLRSVPVTEDFQKIQGRTGLVCTIRSSSVMHHAKDIYPRKNMQNRSKKQSSF